MLQREHSAILLTFIKPSFVIKIFVLSIFEWPFYIGFSVHFQSKSLNNLKFILDEVRKLVSLKEFDVSHNPQLTSLTAELSG